MRLAERASGAFLKANKAFYLQWDGAWFPAVIGMCLRIELAGRWSMDYEWEEISVWESRVWGDLPAVCWEAVR
jgi:hypothetical protein